MIDEKNLNNQERKEEKMDEKNIDNSRLSEERWIDFSDFLKVEMRVGVVVEATEPEWSNKLIKQVVDFGEQLGRRTIFSGIKKWYRGEDLQGKRLVYVTNLAPRKMGDEVSEGMILAASAEDGKPVLWEMPETVAIGSLVG